MKGGREGGRTWVILPIMALTAGSSVGSNTRNNFPKSQKTLPHRPWISLEINAMS